MRASRGVCSGSRAIDFEREHFEFFARVRRAYLERCRRHPERYLPIDAGREPQQVTRTIVQALTGKMALGAATDLPGPAGADNR